MTECRILRCFWAWPRTLSQRLAETVVTRKYVGGVRWLIFFGSEATSLPVWHLEDQFDQLAHEQDIAIFCSFLMDNFDGDVHARMLPRLGENHSHLIPVEDYSRLERAVSEALQDAVGPDESRVLEGELLSRFAASIPNAAISGFAFGIATDSARRCR